MKSEDLKEYKKGVLRKATNVIAVLRTREINANLTGISLSKIDVSLKDWDASKVEGAIREIYLKYDDIRMINIFPQIGTMAISLKVPNWIDDPVTIEFM